MLPSGLDRRVLTSLANARHSLMYTPRPLVSAFGAVAALAAMPAHSEELLQGEFFAGYQSMYEFRGVDRGDDRVITGADLAYDLGDGLNFVGGLLYGTTSDDDSSSVPGGDELQLYLGFNHKVDKLTAEAGYIFYHYFDDADASSAFTVPTGDQQELYLTLAYELPEDFIISLGYFYEFDLRDGGYAELQLSRTFALNDQVGLRVALGAAYSQDYNLDRTATRNAGRPVGLDGMSHYFAEVSAPWAFRENITITPFLKATLADDDLLTSGSLDKSQDFFLGGASVRFAF